MNVLIAGVGALGQSLIERYLARGDQVRVLAYAAREFEGLSHPKLETVVGDVTRPEQLQRVCEGIELVISCIGITRMKGRLTHMAVDYQGNVNLLREAEKAGVKKFGFISPAGVDEGRSTVPLLEAKGLFEDELHKASIDWLLFRSGGFFTDLGEMAKMAQKGVLFVIGDGNNFFTPIDVSDLANVMVEDLDKRTNEIVDVGGPEDLSWNDIGRTSFEHYQKRPRIWKVPKGLCEATLWVLKPFAKSSYAMGKLLVFMSTVNLPTEKRGVLRFANYLRASDEESGTA